MIESIGKWRKSFKRGNLVHKLLATGKYILVNNSLKCEGGPFTRVDPSNPNIKSVLSLVIISVGLENYVEKLEIDQQRKVTPHRAISKNRNLVYTDHFSLILTFKKLPLRRKSSEVVKSSVLWNTNKIGCWEKYLDLTTNSNALENIAENAENLSSEEIMNQLTRRMEKIKFKAFGKVKRRFKTLENDKDLIKLYEQKANENVDQEKVDKDINNKILEYQMKDYEKKLYNLNKLKTEKGKSAAVFKLKNKIVGTKKVSQEEVPMKDPITGELIVEN